ncbi:MAG TPA: M48 family metalloprotease, partial [Noviherbaspirillum sp.]|nr:M48 family metalloprotease [Noviherbaspirillum sp.]
VVAFAMPPAVVAQAEQLAPFTGVPAKEGLELEEQRIWDESVGFDRTLRRRGSLYGVAELDAYLQEVLDALYPEFKGAIRVRTVNNPDLNAFALPNGSIYVHLGMLARLENEAQLAAVLAHEGAHFAYRHGLQRIQSVKGGAAFALVVGMVGGVAGAPDVGSLLGQVALYSSTYGFSREQEREADRVGFERMVAVGYEPIQGARVFELLRDEAALLEEMRPVMFSSHPKLEERIASFRELSSNHPEAANLTRTDVERFLSATALARADWLKQAFAFSRHKSIIHVLEQAGAAQRFPAHYPFYLAEAYRLRNGDGDAEKALLAYRLALERAPEFAPAYKSLGLVHMAAERKDEARAMFVQYLTLVPDADDAAFVTTYLQQLQ